MKYLTALTLALLAAGSAAAQTTDQPAKHGANGPCKADVEKLCPDVKPGGGRIMACMKENQDKISPACKAMLEKRRAKQSSASSDASDDKN